VLASLLTRDFGLIVFIDHSNQAILWTSSVLGGTNWGQGKFTIQTFVVSSNGQSLLTSPFSSSTEAY